MGTLLPHKMAAAAATVARASRTRYPGEQRKQKRDTFEILSRRDLIFECNVERQVLSAIGLQWVNRKLAITAKRLCFCRVNGEESTVIDYVPLHEIKSLYAVEGKEGKLSSEGKDSTLPTTPSLSYSRLIAVDRDPFALQDDDKHPDSVLIIETDPDGFNAGRQSVICFESKEMRDTAHTLLKKHRLQALEEQAQIANPGRFRQAQRRALMIYESFPLQILAMLAILGSFVVSLVQAQMQVDIATHKCYDPLNLAKKEVCRAPLIFWWSEVLFTFVFAAEVSLAMFALGRRRFFASTSNIFDFIIVILCAVSVLVDEVPHYGEVRMLRVLRLLRVFTLIERISPLRIMLNALANAAMPVALVFLLLFLVLAVFSLVATELFSEVAYMYLRRMIQRKSYV